MDFGGDLWKIVSSCCNFTASTPKPDAQAAIRDGKQDSPSRVSAQNDWFSCFSGSANGEGSVYYDELYDVYRFIDPESNNTQPFDVSLNPIPQVSNFHAYYDVQLKFADTTPKQEEKFYGLENSFVATNLQPINGVPCALACLQPKEEEEEEENMQQPCALLPQQPKEKGINKFEDVIPPENRRNLNVESIESFRLERRRRRDIIEFEVKVENLLVVDDWDWLRCGKTKTKGSKYDKLYYKCCNFKANCVAKKHVQRKDVDEEEIYFVSFIEKHNHDEPTQLNASTYHSTNHQNNKRKKWSFKEPSYSHPQTSVSSSTAQDHCMNAIVKEEPKDQESDNEDHHGMEHAVVKEEPVELAMDDDITDV